ncbi:hypothetical protein LCGC14_3061290 [marine sediment metagenome]|uniref:Uncharacterized protein n=1 Tax=marine sediment metagenome TaxID=412755 RepID=A0A0F8YRK1_9ZZZZ
MIKFTTTGAVKAKRQKLANKIVNMLNDKYRFNLKTVDSSNISESIYKILDVELIQFFED